MGANKSKLKENESELKPKVETDLSNEPSDNDGKETSKEEFEQNVNIFVKDNVKKSHDENVKKDEKEDPDSEYIIKTDDKSIHDDKCPSSEHAKGIICNSTHICSKDSKFQIKNITDEELTEHLDTSLNNAVSNSDWRLESVGNDDGKIVFKKTTVEVINLQPPPSPEKKSGKHVTWNTKVKAKNTEDGTVSEEDLKQCDSCQSLVEDHEKRKVKVQFVKSKPQRDKDSSSDIQDEDITRDIYICDSCDLDCSKKILKK